MEKHTTFMDWKTHKVKMSVHPKLIYRLNAFSIKSSEDFCRYRQADFKTYMKSQSN